ncbi:MAG: sigma-54-dependent Fis family transcriptional regulator [Planctomycetes bacterium]|nr:sigma-54-dependent Fis family transcriptional regulator [Planctomycetota bacterium]HPY74901.1 sigma-54 dependent transcriptional regulator [Planctomycetota bacterium]HQB00533.1 sigma-54 dependent transcriptional regulator [Planctomycetota bacterium]
MPSIDFLFIGVEKITSTKTRDILDILVSLMQNMNATQDICSWGKFILDCIEELSMAETMELFEEKNRILAWPNENIIIMKKIYILTLDQKHYIRLTRNKVFSKKQQKIFQILENLLKYRNAYSVPNTPTLADIPTLPHPTKVLQKQRKDLKYPYPEIIGNSPALIEVLEILDKIVATEVPILIQGESGTGKELIARAIHAYSSRVDKPFITENCAAIPESLLESELFGHTKGSFTGAYQDKKGLFEIAHTGSLFLDEVGDMSLSMQKKLLRALQNGEIRAIGAKKSKYVNVRLITATNKDLVQGISDGTFREDLFYRLNVINLVLPPLRDRGSDILLLFQHFLEQNATKMQISIPNISEETKEKLLQYSWPGNIREMQNEVKRILALLDGNIIKTDDLSPEILAL